jgi:hypothetical protein
MERVLPAVPAQERRVWTTTEDAEIFDLVQKYGTRQWWVAALANELLLNIHFTLPCIGL